MFPLTSQACLDGDSVRRYSRKRFQSDDYASNYSMASLCRRPHPECRPGPRVHCRRGISRLPPSVVTVTNCRPAWRNVWGPNGVRTIRLPVDTVKIYVPSTMSDLFDPVDLAAADWNSLVGPIGFHFERVSAPCGTGPDCIEIVEGPVPGGGCAQYDASTIDDDGFQVVNGVMTFPPGWTAATTPRLRRSVNHELGHALGLFHNTCSASQSIMGPKRPVAPPCRVGWRWHLLPTICGRSGMASTGPVTRRYAISESTTHSGDLV